MAWTNGNSAESFFTSMENTIGSYSAPILNGIAVGFKSVMNYPNLAAIAATLVAIGAKLGFDKCRRKKAKEHKRNRDTNLDLIPQLQQRQQALSESVGQLNANMLAVTEAAAGVSGRLLRYSQAQGEQTRLLNGLTETSEKHTNSLDNLTRRTNEAHGKLDKLSTLGQKIETVEGLQRSTMNTMEEMLKVRPKT